MKSRDVKKCVSMLALLCCIGILGGCSTPQAGQDTGEAEGVVELPGGAYVSDEEAESTGDAEDGIEGAGVQAADQQLSEAPSQTANAEQLDEGMAQETAPGRKLTAEELEEYTEWIQDRSNYGFLLSEWQNPTQIDLYEVFYGGAGISHGGTEEQIQAFLDRYKQEEIYTDFWVIDKADLNAFLLEKVGFTYDELLVQGSKGMEDLYYPETDSFCHEAGDTNYCMFKCTDGVENEEGTIITLYCEGNEWVKKCEVKVKKDSRQFLSNHIMEGSAVDVDLTSSLNPAGSVTCLIDDNVFDNLQTDADASAVENSYVLGDWSRITKEALQGIWYHHPKDVGDSKEYDVVLQFDGEDAIVYYPAVEFYGEARYEWDVVDRSDRGLCPELAIYWRGTHDGELAWYILGISDDKDFFWCNGEVFYKQ